MKKILLPFILFASMSALAQKLDGPFKIIAGQFGEKLLTQTDIERQHIVKIFKEGYWMCAYFGDPEQPFNGSCGGTYKIADGKYIETVNFYSWDSTAVGDVYRFNYKLESDRYIQDGKMDSDKYPNFIIKEEYSKIKTDVPLQNTSLEGVWQLQYGEWGNTNSKQTYPDVTMIKIYAYPRFAFAWYNEKTKGFVGAGGGSYQFDGDKLIENVEYYSWGKLEFPIGEFNIQLAGDSFIQKGWNNTLTETWKRLK